MDKIPYDFDLYFDLKTEEDVLKKYKYLLESLELLTSLMKSHGIKID